jgi:nucleoside-diphosphate-sugar epimerase
MSDDNLAKPLPKVFLYAPGCEFVLPYVERELPDREVVTDMAAATDCVAAVMVSSVDAYQRNGDDVITEDTALTEHSEIIDVEQTFRRRCSEQRLAAVILRCPPIVGTGMTGLMRLLAEDIAAGRFFRVNGDDEARLSVVHAVDIAQAVRLTLGQGGEYIVADGHNPSVTELSDALAHRISDKRILIARNKWVSWMVSHKLNRQLAQCPLCSSQRLVNQFGFKPTSVVDYLRTHVYDENSL